MIRVPGDKSISHRALLLAALADGTSVLEGVLPGADCRSTAAILRALGAAVPELPPGGSPFRIGGAGLHGLTGSGQVLDCGNSGTTARLLLGLLAGLGLESVLTGDDSLRRRPMARVTDPLSKAGARFEAKEEGGRLPMRVHRARVESIRHRSPVASAQVKSALLLAGLGAGVSVEVEEPVPSRDHSERLLRRTGVDVRNAGDRPHRVSMPAPPDRLQPLELQVPGDISSAAFFLVLGLLAEVELQVENVGLNPTRTGILRVLERMGAEVGRENLREMDDAAGEPAGDLNVAPGRLEGVELGEEEIPSLIDEVPILAVAATRAEGTTVIRGAAELRVKESDRIAALAGNLEAVGARVEELPDGLVVHGSDRPLEGKVRSFGDHRIAMAFGVLGAVPGNRIEVDDHEVVEVSFPGFWELLEAVAPTSRPRIPSASGPAGGPDYFAGGPVVTVDGPAGSGKSSTAREVARRLRLCHLDSGALYRAATRALLDSRIPESEWEDAGLAYLEERDLRLTPGDGGFRVVLDGQVQEEELRSDRVNAHVSRVAAMKGVRSLLLPVLRAAAHGGGVVADGRDMGTVVFPDADLKVYLTADLKERARRRLLEEGREPDPRTVERASRELARRDEEDRNRAVAPLRRPEEALAVDTTDLHFEEQVARIVRAARELEGRSPLGS